MTKRRAPTRNEAVTIVLRQEGRCQRCKEKLRPGEIEYDHIHPVVFDGPNDLDNYRALCVACHDIVTNGTKATSYGSTKHAAAKTRRLAKGGKTRRGRKIENRGFDKSLRRKMNGSVERIER